jgi:hypothetical protein
MRRSAGTDELRPSSKAGIFPDSIGIETHHFVLRRPFPVSSFVGARSELAALGAFPDSSAAPSPITAGEWAADFRSPVETDFHKSTERGESVMNQTLEKVGRQIMDFGSSFPAVSHVP